MTKINHSTVVNQETLLRNRRLEKQFIGLGKSRQQSLIKDLDSGSRKMLLALIRKHGEVEISEKTRKLLNKKIKKLKNVNLSLARVERTTFLDRLSHSLKKIFGNIAYRLNYLTAHKARHLIKRQILKNQNIVFASPKRLNQLIKQAIKLAKIHPETKIKLSDFLKEKGFDPFISDLYVSNKIKLDVFDLEGVTFNNCKFEWAKFSGLNLNNVSFIDCKISNTSFMNANLKNCKFENCIIRETMFTGTSLEAVSFKKSQLICNSFEDAHLSSCFFSASLLPGTHFFDAAIEDCSISRCNLQDTLFFGKMDLFQIDKKSDETAVVTKPTAAILVNPEMRGVTTPKAFLKLDQAAHMIPVCISAKAQNVSQEEVNSEVTSMLEEIGPYDSEKLPIAQQLLKIIRNEPESESAIILNKAKSLASHVDSIFLPGGEDIPPALYGKEVESKTEWGNDYRRSILELALVQQSFKKGIPLMAICRGFQVANVYFGAQLKQHVKWQEGKKKFKLNTEGKNGLYAQAMKKNIVGVVSHHQGIPIQGAPTRDLLTVVTKSGLVEATELKNPASAPMILLQFHPEFYRAKTSKSFLESFYHKILRVGLSKGNDLFWRILSDSARAYRTKKIALEEIRAFRPRSSSHSSSSTRSSLRLNSSTRSRSRSSSSNGSAPVLSDNEYSLGD